MGGGKVRTGSWNLAAWSTKKSDLDHELGSNLCELNDNIIFFIWTVPIDLMPANGEA